jgi:hypothetical protein
MSLDTTNTQTIFDAIKTADNSTLWAYAGEISNLAKRAKAASNSDQPITEEYIESLRIDELLADPSKLRTRVLASLIKGSDAGNHQASDKLAKLAGIDSATQDLDIKTVSFAEVVVNCPDCGRNVYQPSDQGVESATDSANVQGEQIR